MLYAVCLNTERSDIYADDWWIIFVEAFDSDHAEQIATAENPYCAVVCTPTAVPKGGKHDSDGA